MEMVIKLDEIQNIFDQQDCMKGDLVNIHLGDDAKSYYVTTANRIPFPILSKIRTKFERLDGDDIIEKLPNLQTGKAF